MDRQTSLAITVKRSWYRLAVKRWVLGIIALSVAVLGAILIGLSALGDFTVDDMILTQRTVVKRAIEACRQMPCVV